MFIVTEYAALIVGKQLKLDSLSLSSSSRWLHNYQEHQITASNA